MRILGFILAVLLGYASFIDAANNRLTLQGKDLFISGTNVPWVNFGNDFADSKGSMPKFEEAIIKVREAGGNAIRVWVYTDCSYAPKFGSDGLVSEMGKETINNVKTLLDAAEEYGVVVDLCLLSFDMMQPGDVGSPQKNSYCDFDLDNNYNLLTTDEGIQAFIDNAVTPLVGADGIKGHPAIMCWEVFNEPEGMSSEHGWTGQSDKGGKTVPMAQIQKVVNRVAAACKKADPKSLVSNGAQCPKYVSANSIGKNYYSDDALIKAGGEATGTLDFYMMHYYVLWQGGEDSPFEQDAANWKLDKPVIIGEFHIGGIDASTANSSVTGVKDVSVEDCYEGSYDKGYAGALSWMYGGHENGTFEGSVNALTNLYDKYTDDVKIKEFVPPANLGNSMMIEFDGLTNDPGASIKLEKEFDLSANKTIKCKVKVAPDADNSGTMQVQFVVKTGTAWEWRQANDDNIFDVETSMDKWQTYEVNFDDMAAWDDPSAKPDTKVVKSVLFKFLGNNFKGKIIIDDVMSGETVISDFNDGFGLWAPDEDKKEAIVAITSFFDEDQSEEVFDAKVASNELTLSVYPNPFNPVTNIAFNLPTAGKVSANVYNVKGDLVQTLSNSYLEKGAHQFTFNGNKLSSGIYFLKIATVGAVKTTKMILLK